MRANVRGPLVLACAVALLPTAAPALIDSNLAVSPATQANGGGCYGTPLVPGLLDMLILVNPEWAAVDTRAHTPPVADPITLHGTVVLAKINEGGDLPADHEGDDQNTFITVDPADLGFVATGNVGRHGEEGGQLEVEWEYPKYPLFAWGGRGDRLTAVGRWIWDCGHPDPDPPGSCSVTLSQPCAIDGDCKPPTCAGCDPAGTETCVGVTWNYHSELHPPQAIAVTRTGGYKVVHGAVRFGRRSTRTDVWISPDGGGAGDACLVSHISNPVNLLNTECFPLHQPLADVNAADFAFDIPLPPRPRGAKHAPRIRVLDRTPPSFRRPRALATFVDGPPPRVHVVVKMAKADARGRFPSKVGKTILAAWRPDPTPVTHLQVQVTAIEIVNPLKPVTPAIAPLKRCEVSAADCATTPCPLPQGCLSLGGTVRGWEVFLEVNGDWQRLTNLYAVLDPVTVPQNLTYDLGVLAGDTLHLHATGHSLDCREGQLYGLSFKRALALYGFFPGATCLNSESHNLGTFDIALPGPDYGSGGSTASFVTSSVGGDGGHCSVRTDRLCLSDADCPGESCVVTGGSYKLHYTITQVR